MNLHITNDNYGLFPSVIAERIKNSGNRKNNTIANLSQQSIIRHELITYIPISKNSFKEYINNLNEVDKIIFHPYNFTSYKFLKIAVKKFPNAKIYWVFWSYELYKLPQVSNNLYEPFSAKYISAKPLSVKQVLKKYLSVLLNATGIKKNYKNVMLRSYSMIHFFCSLLPSDFDFFVSVSKNNSITYVPFSYLSLENIMPGMNDFFSKGNKIMIGHSALPDGNHYEIIQKISSIDPHFPVLLPLAYGDKDYISLIKKEACNKFHDVEILETKLESLAYHKKLTEVGWAIINVKVQQGLGNIIALIWIGAKVFLDHTVSTYKDFLNWGIIVYSIQNDLNKRELSSKLTDEQIKINRSKIYERFNEMRVSGYWEEILL